MNLLILGGTGFIGPHQVRYALKRGHKVTLFNRGRTNPGLFPEVEKLEGDRNGKLDALKDRKWDAVIDNPATLPRWVRDAAAVLKDNVPVYLFISTISVYADTSKPGADESAPTQPGGDPDATRVTGETYGPLKAAAEREAQKAYPGRAIVVRPGLIVGPGDPTDRFSYWPLRIARGGDVLAPGDGSDPVQFIDARDLAEWTIRLAEQGARAAGVYNATGPKKTLSMKEMLETCRKVARSDAKLVWAPVDFLEKQRISAWQDMPVWVPGTGETAGFARLSNARALRRGLTFRRLDDTVRAVLDEARRPGAEHLRAGLAPEREKAALEELKKLASR